MAAANIFERKKIALYACSGSIILTLITLIFLIVSPIIAYYSIFLNGIFYSYLILWILKKFGIADANFFNRMIFIIFAQLIYFAGIYIYVNQVLSFLSSIIAAGTGAVVFLLLIRMVVPFGKLALNLISVFFKCGVLAMLPAIAFYFLEGTSQGSIISGSISILFWQIAMAFSLDGIFGK